MIHHCCGANSNGGGGIATYVSSLINSKTTDVSEHPIASLKNIDQSQIKLLHIHDQDLLWELTGECPSVFTLHNHSSYCPSGNRYLADRGVCCDRIMNPVICTWGHLIDGCGSRKPWNIVRDWQNASSYLEVLKKSKTFIIANSDYVRSHIISNGINAERVVTLRCGVQQSKFATEPLTLTTHRNQRILFAGRIIPNKGIGWLLQALTKVDPRIHLDIAGEGWGRPSMERLASQLRLSNRITWHGWCSGEELEALYQQCFAVIFPSLWPEPAGLVTLESYARQRPVIASSVGGIPEHVRDGETGILVPANDVEKLADSISELAMNYQKSLNLGQQGYTWFLEEFTMDIHVKRLQKIYEKAIFDFYD